ncbi:MAG: hypothetical protein EU543_01205 [Promethearchaeota archaeon]|nr:MAG: hypothetical protein EU543_01205 [Candidatus Lokiarchaeota archaeon]
MSSIADDVRQKVMYVLKEEEEKTHLKNLSVLSRVGMKVSSATSAELDADATSASSTALIDLGLRLSEATNHGSLREIILHNEAGYSILMAINDEYIVFSGLTAVYKIGYYLPYLRDLAKKLNALISGDQDLEMALSLEEDELEKLRRKKEEEKEEKEKEKIKKPSLEQDKAALNGLLGFLDDWEKQGLKSDEMEPQNENNIVSIPKTIATGISTESAERSIPETPETTSQDSSDSHFKIYDDEVAPIPLEDYTPMEVDEEFTESELVAEPEPQTMVPAPSLEPKTETASEYGSLPSLDELKPPDFDSETASEYDTEFILEEETESLEAVLKELGWEEE